MRPALLAVVLLATLLLPTRLAHAQAMWLDASPITGWNTPGAAIPMAPPLTNPTPMCQSNEVSASSPEQTQLAARGWRLQNYWPPVSSGGIVLIGALSEYDGMCRPFEFNVFVFSNGTYAGTLSPVLMNSRTDGSLFVQPGGQVATIGPSGSIAADFVRYADTDPLCCPSRGTTRVFYRSQDTPPAVVPDSAQPRPGGSAQIPSALPRTGTPPDAGWLLAALGLGSVALGWTLRRREHVALGWTLGRKEHVALRWTLGRKEHVALGWTVGPKRQATVDWSLRRKPQVAFDWTLRRRQQARRDAGSGRPAA